MPVVALRMDASAERRLGALSPDARDLLLICAFLGDGCALDDVKVVSGLDDDAIAELIDHAVSAGCLRDDGDDRVHFAKGAPPRGALQGASTSTASAPAPQDRGRARQPKHRGRRDGSRASPLASRADRRTPSRDRYMRACGRRGVRARSLVARSLVLRRGRRRPRRPSNEAAARARSRSSSCISEPAKQHSTTWIRQRPNRTWLAPSSSHAPRETSLAGLEPCSHRCGCESPRRALTLTRPASRTSSTPQATRFPPSEPRRSRCLRSTSSRCPIQSTEAPPQSVRSNWPRPSVTRGSSRTSGSRSGSSTCAPCRPSARPSASSGDSPTPKPRTRSAM